MLLGALAVTVTLVIVQYMPTHNDTEIAKFNLIQLFIQSSVQVVKFKVITWKSKPNEIF